MADYYLSRAAIADLDDIWDYIAQDSVSQADKMQERLFSACQQLARNPHQGRPRPELRTGLRIHLVKPYTLFYTIDLEEMITVRRVIHHSRDLDALF